MRQQNQSAEAAVEEPVVEVPLEVFDITPEPATIDTTLEKLMDPIVEPVTVEEAQIEAHPLEAPHAAQTEMVHEQSAEETAAETEDSILCSISPTSIRADRWAWAARKKPRSGSGGSFLTAIDYKTGKIVWNRPYYGYGGGGGLLTTAGKLVFGGDGADNLVANDVNTGKPLWHTRIGDVTNAPQTFMLDGHQYLIAATGDTLWAFLLY